MYHVLWLVLLYLACATFDISFKNFSATPLGCHFYIFKLNRFGLNVPQLFHLFQSCFCFCYIRNLAPVSFGTAKLETSFLFPRKKFYFFSFSFPPFQARPSGLSVPSEAGCKGRKLFRFPKINLKIYFLFLLFNVL